MKIAHRRLPDDDTGRWAGLKLLEVVAELTLGITVFVSKGEPHIKYWSVVVPSLRPSLNLALVVVLVVGMVMAPFRLVIGPIALIVIRIAFSTPREPRHRPHRRQSISRQ